MAVPEIRKVCPEARLLVLLRNPIALAHSLHGQLLRQRDENVKHFETAWALCNKRRNGLRIPRYCREPKKLLYDCVPLLGQQLQRLLSVFPREQVHWWFYDDFRADPALVYQEALQFLDLLDDGRREFPRVNVRVQARLQGLAQFTERTPAPLAYGAMWLKKQLGIKRWGVRHALQQINFVSTEPAELSTALTTEMSAHFAPDVRLLESITGRDLSHWLKRAE